LIKEGERQWIIKHRCAVFDGNDPQHLLTDSSDHQLLGYIE